CSVTSGRADAIVVGDAISADDAHDTGIDARTRDVDDVADDAHADAMAPIDSAPLDGASTDDSGTPGDGPAEDGSPADAACHGPMCAPRFGAFVRIGPGSFVMGSPSSDPTASGVETPQHRVLITRPFWLGATEVTQQQFLEIMGFNPSHAVDCGGDCPVD